LSFFLERLFGRMKPWRPMTVRDENRFFLTWPENLGP
jgi:hypothetical protein